MTNRNELISSRRPLHFKLFSSSFVRLNRLKMNRRHFRKPQEQRTKLALVACDALRCVHTSTANTCRESIEMFYAHFQLISCRKIYFYCFEN